MATTTNPSDSPSPATSSAPAPSLLTPIASITVQNVVGMVPTKLNRQNYITWRSLFLPILKRFKLLGLINGEDPCPLEFIRDSSGSRILNPDYEAWCERDQILTIWIHSTLAEDLLPLTIEMEDSRSLWQSLERRFAGALRTHVHSLRSKIQNIQKGDSSLTDYLNSIKEISDKLAAAGEPISEKDLVAYILSGLPDEYESFIDSIETRSEDVNANELHGLLLSKEISLQKRKTRSSSSSAPFHAYTAQPHPSVSNSFLGNSRGKSQYRNRSNQNRHFGANQNGNFGPNPNRYFGANRHGNFGAHRNSGGVLGPAPNQNRSSSFFSGRPNPCQLCHQHGHLAISCGQLSQFASQHSQAFTNTLVGMSAMTGSSSPSYWLTDSGVSHHVTPDPASLNSAIPYTGTEQLFIGDGKGLYISHTGSALLRTANAAFKLNNVLFVPKASHNLRSVYRFVHNNWCSLTFDPFGFYVKDLRTGRTLFQGPSEGGLYPFYWNASNGVSGIAISPHALMIAKADIHIWHRRLGHPSSIVLNKVVKHSNLPIVGSVHKQSFCSDCQLGKASRLPFSVLPCTSTRPFHIIHADVWGPSPTPSCTGYKYYLILVDDFTKYSWLYPLYFKSDVCYVL
ncbi:hypothetical protein EV1_007888 [Malus domestica]